jgi:hypothetical protein
MIFTGPTSARRRRAPLLFLSYRVAISQRLARGNVCVRCAYDFKQSKCEPIQVQYFAIEPILTAQSRTAPRARGENARK